MLSKADIHSFQQFQTVGCRVHIGHDTHRFHKSAGHGFRNAEIDTFTEPQIICP